MAVNTLLPDKIETLGSSAVRGFRLLLAFGSNLGNKEEHVQEGLKYLQSRATTLQMSSWLYTKPWVNPAYPAAQYHQDYLNFIIEIATQIDPYQFYQTVIVPIENIRGHSRIAKWEPRGLDIDILYAALNDAVSIEDCTPFIFSRDEFFIPHTAFFDRDFWRELLEEELNLKKLYRIARNATYQDPSQENSVFRHA